MDEIEARDSHRIGVKRRRTEHVPSPQPHVTTPRSQGTRERGRQHRGHPATPHADNYRVIQGGRRCCTLRFFTQAELERVLAAAPPPDAAQAERDWWPVMRLLVLAAAMTFDAAGELRALHEFRQSLGSPDGIGCVVRPGYYDSTGLQAIASGDARRERGA